MGATGDYKGLTVVDPDPVGDGGLLVNNALKALADRAGPVEERASDPLVTNDIVDTAAIGKKFYTWSKWRNTTTDDLFMCADPSAGAAVWVKISSGGGVDTQDWKNAVDTVAYSNVVLTGEQTISGVTTSTSRIAVTENTDRKENGIYVTAAGAWTRATDADTDEKITNGFAALVANPVCDFFGEIVFVQAADPITIGVTEIVFNRLEVHNATFAGSIPNFNDDISDGFRPGAVAIRFAVAPRQIYMCTDNTLNDAKWELISNGEVNRSFIDGLTLSNDLVTPDEKVVIAPGTCRNISTNADITNTLDMTLDAALTIDITVAGDGGLDTGAVAADTWYSVFIIGLDSASVTPASAVFSTSSVEPTFPVGYNRSRLIGWVRTDALGDIIRFVMLGKDRARLVEYRENRADLQVLNNGSATAMTVVDLSSLIPPTVFVANLQTLGESNSDGAYFAIEDGDSAITRANAVKRFGLGKDTGGFDQGGMNLLQPTNASQEIQYGVNVGSTSLDIFVTGYTIVL